MKKMLLISNMYPKSDLDFFGIFVKKFELGIKEEFFIKKVVLVGNTNTFFLKGIKYLIFYLKIFYNIFYNFDVVYVHFPTRSAVPILLNPFFYKRLIVLNYHGSDLNSLSKVNRFLNFILTPLIKRSSLIVVPSHVLRSTFLNKYNNINIFISASSGVPDNFYIKNIKNNYTLNISFIYLSSLLESKGILTLLDSIKKLINKGYKFRCSIYGEGPLLEYVKSFSKKYNTFVSYKGILENGMIPQIYSKHDFFIFPSKTESLGLVGLEALACGLPVIGSKIPAIESYLIDEYNGLLFDPFDSNDLTEKIEILLQNRMLLVSLKNNSSFSVLKFKNSHINYNLVKKLNETIRDFRG
ncbi:glycosyltransferase family 4 protein [Algoriphagus sp. oki45]|uniref:glycosyltransferase family 4 protein n=1 Tax=Algoriphagus sp. oki45 TaxID=3067294 RepID=UPI0030C68532